MRHKKTALAPPQSGASECKPARAEARKKQGVRGGRGKRGKSPRNHRELAQAIFAQCDPVTVGKELLESGSERGGSVKARVWETLVEFLLGKPAPAGGAASGANVRIVWDLPAPPHETGKS